LPRLVSRQHSSEIEWPIQGKIAAELLFTNLEKVDTMSTKIALANVLRIVAENKDSLTKEILADVLDGVADGLESDVTVGISLQRAPQAPGTKAPTAPATSASDTDATSEEGYEAVTEGFIEAGDEWKLRDGLTHTDGREVTWREVTADLVGKPVTDFSKSLLRRPDEDAFEDVTEGFIEAGDQWKLSAGLKHRDGRPTVWRTVEDSLVGKDVAEFEKSQFRRKA